MFMYIVQHILWAVILGTVIYCTGIHTFIQSISFGLPASGNTLASCVFICVQTSVPNDNISLFKHWNSWSELELVWIEMCNLGIIVSDVEEKFKNYLKNPLIGGRRKATGRNTVLTKEDEQIISRLKKILKDRTVIDSKENFVSLYSKSLKRCSHLLGFNDT